MVKLRWAFRCTAWQPSAEEWVHGMSCVQQEERERIRKFTFQRDAKSALAGRLLIRKAVSESLHISFGSIQLGRTEKGKPYLVNSLDYDRHLLHFDFNISHQGDYVVLAAESSNHVGIDLMKVERPVGSKTVDQFFSTMTRQFTKSEWEIVKSAADEFGQLSNFYRFWCLKESFVKLVGLGIGYSLRRLNFSIHSGLTVGQTVDDTQVEVDDRLQKDWKFEETMLDDHHIVAVALRQLPQVAPEIEQSASSFIHLSPQNLFDGTAKLRPEEPSDWEEFSRKPLRPIPLDNS